MKDSSSPRSRNTTIAMIIAAAVLGVATLVICCVMNFVLIPQIEQDASMRCFDMCATGYTPQDARAFVESLSESALSVYVHRQLPLDFVYPVVYAGFFVLLWLLLRAKPRWFVGVPIALAAIDYAENALALRMLTHTFSDKLVHAASWCTILKSVLMYVVFAAIGVAVVVRIVQAVRRRCQAKNA